MSSYTNKMFHFGSKPLKYSPKDNLMGDLNLDRFGNPIEKKSPPFETPGPGSYNHADVTVNKPNQHTFGVFSQAVSP